MYNTSIVFTVTTLFAVLLTAVIGLSESAGHKVAWQKPNARSHLSPVTDWRSLLSRGSVTLMN